MIPKDFYPTPPALIAEMVDRINFRPNRILDPSAGRGAILDALREDYRFATAEFCAIEVDRHFQAELAGKGYTVLGSDFLKFSGPDKFDLVIANPPFADGAKHLLKMLDMVVDGQVICLLNAETIRNPYAIDRKMLLQRLEEIGAEIIELGSVFVESDRPTTVEAVMVVAEIKVDVEKKLFEGLAEAEEFVDVLEDGFDLSKFSLEEMEADYLQRQRVVLDVITNYYRNFRKVGACIDLVPLDNNRVRISSENLSKEMVSKVNAAMTKLRRLFWRRVLDLPEVNRRLTRKKADEFYKEVEGRCVMEFSADNVRQFILNLMESYEQTLFDAVVEVFHMLSRKYSYSETPYEKNIHYYNGWKTNCAWKVKKKVILPVSGYYAKPFMSFDGMLRLDFEHKLQLRDIDVVMNYFDDLSGYISIADALERAFAEGRTEAESTYFKIRAYKKGTIHLTFRDEDVLARFNRAAALGKKWLPPGYGKKWSELSDSEREVIQDFEGREAYERDAGSPIFLQSAKPLLPG